jgi:hypothetical protein
LRVQIGTRRLAAIAVFAAVYAVLNLIPVSRLVGSVTFLSMANVFSPLAGMVLGPLPGGLSVLVGTFVSFALGKTVAFDGFDFIPGVVAAVTAGLAIKGRIVPTIVLSAVLYAVYLLDPLSLPFVQVGSFPVPFLWMHMLSAVLFVAVALLRRGANDLVAQSVLVASAVFVSTMNGHVAGSLMAENILFRLNHVIPSGGYAGYWTTVFALYPLERVFFTVVGSVIAIGVLKALPPATLKTLRRDPE